MINSFRPHPCPSPLADRGVWGERLITDCSQQAAVKSLLLIINMVFPAPLALIFSGLREQTFFLVSLPAILHIFDKFLPGLVGCPHLPQ
jgi:hypothetical protein